MSKAEATAGNPKLCPKCGEQGLCYDTRMVSDYVKRRYRCRSAACATRWGTAEFFITEGSDNNRNKVQEYRRNQAKQHVSDLLQKLHEAMK